MKLSKPQPVRWFKAAPDDAVEIMDLTLVSCRYPYGNEPPYMYCGKTTYKIGAAWCKEHHALVYPPEYQRRMKL